MLHCTRNTLDAFSNIYIVTIVAGENDIKRGEDLTDWAEFRLDMGIFDGPFAG